MNFMPGEIDMDKQYEELWNMGSLQCVQTTDRLYFSAEI